MLTLGYDWQKDEISSSEAFSVDSRLNKGWFAQYPAGTVARIGN